MRVGVRSEVVLALGGGFVVVWVAKHVLSTAAPETLHPNLDERARKKIAYKQKLREQILTGGEVGTEDAKGIDRDQERDTEGNDSNAHSCIAPGQSAAKSWIVMDLGQEVPSSWMDPWRYGGGHWRLRVEGIVAEAKSVKLKTIERLGVREYTMDWNCVTGWSFSGLRLFGVPLREFIEQVCLPRDGWEYLYQESADGYTTVVSREDAMAEDAFVAIYDGDRNLLPREHGGIRLVFPKLYGWKSAKFLSAVHFLRSYKAGFWEGLGCHPRGRAQYRERFTPKSRAIWTLLIWITSQYQLLGYGWWVFVMQNGGRALGQLVTTMQRSVRAARFGAVAARRAPLQNASCAREEERGGAVSGRIGTEEEEGGAAEGLRRLEEIVSGLGYRIQLGDMEARWGGQLQEGDVVYVAKAKCRATVQCMHVTEDGPFHGLTRIQYPSGARYHVRGTDLARVHGGRCVIVVAETKNFRALATSQVGPGDCVLEIGCASGATSAILAQKAKRVVAVDIDSSLVTACKAEHSYPNLEFHHLDCLRDRDRLAHLAPAPALAMIDINGNRNPRAVVHAITAVAQTVAPDVMVVKSRHLARLLASGSKTVRSD